MRVPGAADHCVTWGSGQRPCCTGTANGTNAVLGVATFTGCKIDKKGTNDTLTATATGLTAAVSAIFNIT